MLQGLALTFFVDSVLLILVFDSAAVRGKFSYKNTPKFTARPELASADAPRPAQLDFTVGGLKLISENHSFHYAGAPYKYLYGGVPYKSPKIAENRRKSELQADLRGSLILLLIVKSSCADLICDMVCQIRISGDQS